MARLAILHLRGGTVESRHDVSAVLVAADGSVLERIGEPLVTTFRSAAKPFQLEASVAALPSDVAAALGDDDLAVGAASHHGEPVHVERVRALLARFGASEEALLCGVHPPADERAARDLYRAGAEPSAIHNNCSGKHAFMVAAARALGAAGDYRAPDHPLQVRVRERLDARTGGAVTGVVVDGCGVPCFVLPIDGMARAYAALADAMRDADAGALGRIGRAMAERPLLMSGTRAVDGGIVEAATEPVTAKVGAEGLLCVAVPSARAGLAVKVASANADARAVATYALLERFFPGLVPVDAGQRYREVRNHAGALVGERVAVFE